MTCNTTLDYCCHNDQDEWTPYIAFPLHNTKERLFSYHVKRCKPPDKMLFKHNSFPSTKYKSRDVSEKNGFEKPCSALESTCYRENKNEKLEKSSLNNFGISNFSSDSTAQIWDKLKECCKAKARTHWPNSCANGYFLQSLRVLKKPVCFDEERDISLWNLQRCTCKKYRRTSKELDETLEKLVESDEECESPCLCPKYFISKSGLVFGSHEEKQRFDEKMEMMDQVFKSELETIKEQHERLRTDLTDSKIG